MSRSVKNKKHLPYNLPYNLPSLLPPCIADVLLTTRTPSRATGPGSTGPPLRRCSGAFPRASSTARTGMRTTSAPRWPRPKWVTPTPRNKIIPEGKSDGERGRMKSIVFIYFIITIVIAIFIIIISFLLHAQGGMRHNIKKSGFKKRE